MLLQLLLSRLEVCNACPSMRSIINNVLNILCRIFNSFLLTFFELALTRTVLLSLMNGDCCEA